MAIIKWSPMTDPFDEMDRMIKQFAGLPAIRQQAGFIPPVDVYETDDAIVIETPLAGFNPGDVTVEMEGDTLVIAGDSNSEREVDEKNYYRKEVRNGTFRRVLRMPAKIDKAAISAEFESGLLKITAPKMQKEESKKIEVKINKK